MPSWIKNLQGLERITMSLSNLGNECDPLETLQHLPSLFEVRLTESSRREILCFKAGGFLKLKKLTLRNMKLLRRVTIENGAMPSINQLTMRGLPLPEELPLGIQRLRRLQRLDLLGMSSQLINKLVEEEESEDYKTIIHVPKVTVGFLFHGRWKLFPLSKDKETRLHLSALNPTLDAYESDESIQEAEALAMESYYPFLGSGSWLPPRRSMAPAIWDTSSKPNYSWS